MNATDGFDSPDAVADSSVKRLCWFAVAQDPSAFKMKLYHKKGAPKETPISSEWLRHRLFNWKRTPTSSDLLPWMSSASALQRLLSALWCSLNEIFASAQTQSGDRPKPTFRIVIFFIRRQYHPRLR
jgi:GT2 family glycosyltransferase